MSKPGLGDSYDAKVNADARDRTRHPGPPSAPKAPPPTPEPPTGEPPKTEPPKGEPPKTEAPKPRREPPPVASPSSATTAVDIEAFSRNMARVIEQGGRGLAAYLKPREQGGHLDQESSDLMADGVKTLGQVLEYWLADPQRATHLQTSLGKSYLDLWASAVKRMAGEPAAPVAPPDPRDK